MVSTTLANTENGLIGSIALGAGMELTQYTINSAIFHDDFTWSGALIATGLGALGGLTSGRGAQHFKFIGSNLDDTGKTGVKAIITVFDRYGTGAGYQKVMNLWRGITIYSGRAILETVIKGKEIDIGQAFINMKLNFVTTLVGNYLVGKVVPTIT